MEKILHFTIPRKITSTQAETIQRARALHPTWEIRVWQDPILSDEFLLKKYWPKANSGAQLADLIRLDVIYKWGGVYADGDMLLLKPLDALVETYDVFFASAFGNNIEGALFGARKSHPIMRELIDDLLLNEPDWSLPPDRTTGPDFLARVVRWNTDVTILPREAFYSYGPRETHSRRTHRHCFGEHLWEVSWKNLKEKPPNLPVSWRSILRTLARPFIVAGFRTWHRVKALDPLAPDKSPLVRQPIAYAAHGEIVVRTAHGFNVVVDGADTDHAPKVVFGDDVELRDEIALKEILSGGDWVIDVGPKVASFCILAGQRVGSFGRVFVYQSDQAIANLIEKSSILNRMNDRIILRTAVTLARQATEPTGNAGHDGLDHEFPIDMPIKLLKIDFESGATTILNGARRLLGRRCIDFLQIGVFKEALGPRWRRELGGSRLNELMKEFSWLLEVGYVVCTISWDGSLVEHKNVLAGLDKLQGRGIILRARDQYASR